MGEHLTHQIKARLESLVNDSAADVAGIADWALETMQSDDPLLEQEPVWRALDELSGADSMTGPGVSCTARLISRRGWRSSPRPARKCEPSPVCARSTDVDLPSPVLDLTLVPRV
ncbi:hypothetical protein [Streptomyces sp. NBC_01477]|uniref:hypothetical protein n=1 Tax=Streptomyces sp. NBC_01477 TaxID=2976015 RepID=UPI002E32C387|nr:hypothetical protein [Streptomyces sp. NBC_01477]